LIAMKIYDMALNTVTFYFTGESYSCVERWLVQTMTLECLNIEISTALSYPSESLDYL